MHVKLGWRLSIVALLYVSAFKASGAWEPGTQFKVGKVKGHPALIAPDGQPFKSVGVVWAYGPERGPLSGPLTSERLVQELQRIKDLGFNTLNLYGDQLIPEMLTWCDENELAVYFRTSYYSLPDFPGDLKEYPDYMDPKFRSMAQETYTNFLAQIKGHPSVLAIDMDHRWLFQLDWGGALRFDLPKLRPHAVAYFPRWLEARYGSIAELNAAWQTDYASFDDVLKDPDLLKAGVFRKLKNHPARVDVYRYTLWTAADFLKELVAFQQARVPGVLVTPTTEHPECIPETNPDLSTGIAFMSPVHYNGKEDYDRDLPGLCKLIYETRWHYDMQGGPVYISETGFRTATLEQKPPVTAYAWIVPTNEATAARTYAEEFSLLNVLPWVSGYGYFKLYDKVPEGDFGYLRDDATKKPMALVGDAINQAFTAPLADPEPQVWIYYPDYANATHRPGFQQLKSWVAIWEQPFLDALRRRIDEHWDGLSAGDAETGRKFAALVTRDFRKLWRGFAFTKTLPRDNKPILLLSTVSEILSTEDRMALQQKKTITFGPVGVRDDFMKGTDPWYLASLGVTSNDVFESYYRVVLTNGATTFLGHAMPDLMASGRTNSPWPLLADKDYDRAVPCGGEVVSVSPGHYTRLEVLAGSGGGDAAPFCFLEYEDGTRVRQPMGPAISDMRFAPAMNEGLLWNGRYLTRVVIPLDSSKVLTRVELPSASWVRLFGMILVSGGVARDALVVMPGTESATGRTTWWLKLKPDDADAPEAVAQLKVLRQFETGDAAVVAKGTHVAFLFDPLTWAGKPDEISRQVGANREWIEDALKYLRKAKNK